MRFTTTFTLGFIISGLAPSLVLGKSVGECSKVELEGNNNLVATCNSASGSSIKQSLDLNRCYANDKAKLTFRKDGAYLGSCKDCKLSKENDITNLQCSCENGRKPDAGKSRDYAAICYGGKTGAACAAADPASYESDTKVSLSEGVTLGDDGILMCSEYKAKVL